MFRSLVYVLPEMRGEERTAPKVQSAGCAWRIPHRLGKIWDSVSLTAKEKKKKKNIN